MLNQYNLQPDQLVSATTDGTRTMDQITKELNIDNIHCVAHAINLTVQEAVEKCSAIKALLGRVSQIVRYFRQDIKCQDALEITLDEKCKNSLHCIQSIETQWNSDWELAIQYYESNKEISEIQLLVAGAPDVLSWNDIQDLYLATKVLEPFKDATETLCADECVTISSVIPLISDILENIESLLKRSDVVQNGLVKSFIEELQNVTMKRLAPFETKKHFQMATVLDPRFKYIFFRNQANTSIARTHITTELTKRLNSPAPVSATPTIQNARIAAKIRSNETRVEKTPSEQVEKMFNNYLMSPTNDTTDLFQFWQTQPTILHDLAMDVLLPPASSTNTEKVASCLHKLVSDHPAPMLPDYINARLVMQMLKEELLDESINYTEEEVTDFLEEVEFVEVSPEIKLET